MSETTTTAPPGETLQEAKNRIFAALANEHLAHYDGTPYEDVPNMNPYSTQQELLRRLVQEGHIQPQGHKNKVQKQQHTDSGEMLDEWLVWTDDDLTEAAAIYTTIPPFSTVATAAAKASLIEQGDVLLKPRPAGGCIISDEAHALDDYGVRMSLAMLVAKRYITTRVVALMEKPGGPGSQNPSHRGPTVGAQPRDGSLLPTA